MTNLTAAANSTRSLSLDFTSKPPASTTADPHAFASKLLDAQQPAKPEPTPAAQPIDAKKPVEKPKPADDVDDDTAAAMDRAKAKRTKKPEKKSDDDRPVEHADDADDASDKADDKKPVAVKTSDDALLAALAANATPAAKAVAKTDEAKPVNAKPTVTKSADVTAVAAAAAIAAGNVVQANAPDAVDAQPVATTDAKSQAVAASDAKNAKPADAKVDALAAQLKPVEDKTAPLPPEATEQKGGGNAKEHGQQQPQQQQQSPNDPSAAAAQAGDPSAPQATRSDAKDKSFDDALAKLGVGDAQSTRDAVPTPAPVAPTETPLRPEQQFAKDNVDRIVSSVQTQATGNGDGTMNVRLTPPELGPLDVAAKMLDGKMSVAFTTSNEQATQLLSHSLGHLKTSLESAGISVDRIEVRQAASTSTSASSSDRDASGQQQQSGKGFENASQQQSEQQRKQMVEKLWRKYAYGNDEVDLVA